MPSTLVRPDGRGLRCGAALRFCFVLVIGIECSRGAPPAPQLAVIQSAATIGTWAPSTAYAVGALASFAGITYRCRQAHTSQVGWEPPKVPALWERPGSSGINPWTNQTAYVVGSGVTFDGSVYRCIQGHTSQSDWTPPVAQSLWKLTGNVQIPAGVSGSLAFVFKAKNLPAGVANGFGLVQRDAFGDASYSELLDSSQRAVGEIFHRVKVQGGEIFELFLQANKTKAVSSPAMSAATYSSDPTMNAAVDPTTPDHVGQPLQTAAQKASNIWSLRWESFKFGDPGRDGMFNDLTVELRLEAPCNNSQIICVDPNLVVSNHNASTSDYRRDVASVVAPPVPGVAAGPVTDPTAGEGDPTPAGAVVMAGGRVDTLRWSFVQESTDFCAATPPEVTACPQCSTGAPMLGGGLVSLQIDRIHRPRAEAFVSSFGPGVFSNVDAKLTLVPQGLGNQNTVVFFDPKSDTPPVTFFELSSQDGDNSVDGRYRDVATRTFASLVLFNSSGAVESNPFSAKTAVITRQNGEQIKFEIINVQGTGATQLQGRLTAIQDRNGNAATITYQFAASSSDSQLGGDRRKLWLVNQFSDPHGVGATFTYQLRTGTSRWVVQSISLPDGSTRQYEYGTDTANLDRLVRIIHGNGDTSQFSRSWDSATQSWALTFEDAVGGDGRNWKKVYVTGSTYTTADNVVHNQEPNLVRRIVNKDNEQLYKAMEDPNNPNTTYFREGIDKITRLKIDSAGLPRETARATSISSDPLLATFAVFESYGGDVLGMIREATDGLGNSRSFGRDSKTRAIVSATARGGTTAAFMLNAFVQPTRTVDRLGRITDVTYDSKGNPLTIKHAVGTTVQATWTYLYNSRGQVTKLTDPNGKVTDYAYNAAGFLTSITEPPDVTGGTRPVRTFEFTSVGRLLATVDASGRRVTFSYDGRGRLQSTTFPDATTEILTYGSGASAGLLESKRDRNGNLEGYAYDASRRLVKVTRASGGPEQVAIAYEYLPGADRPVAETNAGERVEFTFDERQRPTSRKVFLNSDQALLHLKSWDVLDRDTTETDPYGRRTFRVLDVNGRVTRTVAELVPGGVPSGSDPRTLTRITTGNPPYLIEDKAYDAMNQMVSWTDGNGITTTQSYDAQGRRTGVVEAAGRTEERKTTYAYDLVGNLLSQTEPRTFSEGLTFQTTSSYTGRNLLKTKTEAAGTTDAATTNYVYTATGKLATLTDPRGGQTLHAYDTCCDRLVAQTNPAGSTTTYAYDGVGNRITVTNALGAATSYTYDGLNRLVRQSDPLGHATEYTYDDDLTDGIGLDALYAEQLGGLGFGLMANGTAVRTTNGEGEASLTARDGAGRVILQINPSGSTVETVFDTMVNGLLESSGTDSLGHTIRLREDALGRRRIHVDGEGNIETRTFDPVGNIISERAANGVGQDCQFDGLRQRLNCTDTQGDTTRWTYDSSGNVIKTTDAAGVQTTCEFDRRNRRRRCVNGVGAATAWVYDGNSNITSITDGEGRVTSYAYDARDLRTTETFPDSTGPEDRVVKTYDAAGRLASRKDQGGGVMTFTYDVADRLTEKRDPENNVDSFGYDAANRLVSGSAQRYGTAITRTFDDGGRLATESVALSPTGPADAVTYSYDAADQVSGLQYPDGSVVSRTYDGRKLLQTISRGSTPVATFAYDGGGRLISSTLGNGLVEQRSYRSDRTVSAISTPGVGDLAYSYDAKKRKLSESGTAANGTQNFSYDNQSRLTNWSGPGSTQSWSLSLVGDWQTTTRNSVVETRAHNDAHELTAVASNSLTYDARGNLVADDIGRTLAWDFDNRLRSYSRGAVQVSYLYDVLGRKVGRSEGESTTVFVHAGDEVIAEYIDGDHRVSYILGAEIDKPVAFVAAGALFWYSANPLGTSAAVTDSTGAVRERYRYDAFGARTVLSPSGSVLPSSAIGNAVGFTGRPHDGDLVDFRFRHYDPRLGRFISRDDDYRDGMSLYGAYFVPNDIDPTGHAVGCGEGPELAVKALNSNEAELIAPVKTVSQSVRCPKGKTLFLRLFEGRRQGGICDLGADVVGATRAPKIVAYIPPRPDPFPPYPTPDPGDPRFPRTGCMTCSPAVEGVPPRCVDGDVTETCKIENRLCRDSGVCRRGGGSFGIRSFFDWGWWW